MSSKLPFDLDNIIESYRYKLSDIISKEYNEIDSQIENYSQSFDNKSSKATQQKIFNKFLVTLDKPEFKSFRDNFNAVIVNRAESLERYVKNSTEYIKTWRDNNALREAHFLQTNAREKKQVE